jgi:hypothetical protein
MRLASSILLVFCTVALGASPEEKAPPGKSGTQKKSAPKSKTTQQVFTGCVDEQDGQYVLLDDHVLKKVVNLEAVHAGSEDFFAKHLGHKVTVKGTMSSETEGKFKVSSIEDVAPVCSPEGVPNQK